MVSFRKSLYSTLWTPQLHSDNVITLPIHLQHICELIIFLTIKPFRLIRCQLWQYFWLTSILIWFFFCQFQFLTNRANLSRTGFKNFKKITYCIFVTVHILLGWFWLKLFRTTHTLTCWGERLNFENTLYCCNLMFFSHSKNKSIEQITINICDV
jgi:hypothetical protein